MISSRTPDLQEWTKECVILQLDHTRPSWENSVLYGLKEGRNILSDQGEQEDVLCIEVTDDGCGAPEEWMDAINHRRQEQLSRAYRSINVDTIIHG